MCDFRLSCEQPLVVEKIIQSLRWANSEKVKFRPVVIGMTGRLGYSESRGSLVACKEESLLTLNPIRILISLLS